MDSTRMTTTIEGVEVTADGAAPATLRPTLTTEPVVALHGPGDEVHPIPDAEQKRLQGIKTLLSVVTNKSRAQRVAQALCGPLGRVWERDGAVQVGEQRTDGREVLGQGKTYEEAFLDASRNLSLKEFVDLAGREIRAIAITQSALRSNPNR